MMTTKRNIIWLLLAFVFICSFCYGQKVIPLTKQNGVYTIPCIINGIKRSLVFDTGASTVTISMQFADLLYNKGKLRDSDIKGIGKSQTASGHIVNNMSIVLREIEISGYKLRNVEAVIIEGQNAPLLLGLSAIQKLGKVTLSGNKLVIDSPLLIDSQLNQLRNQINNLIESNNFIEAIQLLKKIESQEAMEENDLFNITQCYCYSQDYNNALMYSQQWMGMYEGLNHQHEADVCYFAALAYKGLKNYHVADTWFSKAIKLVSLDAISRTSIEDCISLSYYYNQKALNYLEGKAYKECAETFDIAAQYRMRVIGVTPEDVCTGKVNDKWIGNTLFSISKINAVYLNDGESADRYAVMSALCGNQEAIDYCKHFNLDYKVYIK